MIDGFTLKITDPTEVESIRFNEKLEFLASVAVDTGIIRNGRAVAKYKNLIFEYCDYSTRKIMMIRGCIADYMGRTNSDNLPVPDAWEGFNNLCSEFNITPEYTQVIALEWGLIIDLPLHITAAKFISSMLVRKGKIPKREPYKDGGLMYTFDLTDYIVKVYDKGIQSKRGRNKLRVELKIKDKTVLNKLGMFHLSDLYNLSILKKLNNHLIKSCDHIVFYDDNIPNMPISSKSRDFFLKYNRAEAWVRLLSTNKEYHRKLIKTFQNRVAEISGVDWNSLLQDAIESESSKLLKCADF